MLIWISFPYFPIHFVNCKSALVSITSDVGKSLDIDHATNSINRTSTARILIKYDVSWPLLSQTFD